MKTPSSSAPETSDHFPMATQKALNAAKKNLRTLMKAKLSQIPKSTLESQSKTAFEALLGLRQYIDAKKISIYLSMPSGEIQTDEIVRHALRAGKDVFVPYLHQNMQVKAQSGKDDFEAPRNVMDMVRLRGLGDYEGLERDAWGIPTVTKVGLDERERVLGEAAESAERRRRVSLDLVLLPGVAFEGEGGEIVTVKRLGHGKGFYDYFLHRYGSFDKHGTGREADAKIALFGLALKEQFFEDGQEVHIPTGPYDKLLDGLIVGDGQIIKSAPI